jgi:hypothetical protein
MFGLTVQGTWWVKCPSDPRWDISGRAQVGAFVRPQEVQDHLDTKQKELGDIPKDLEWGYMKD